VGSLELSDLQEVFADLRELGWSRTTVESLEKQAQSYAAAMTEAWKERGGFRRRYKQANSYSEKLFEKYGWNRMESGFSGF
jgi:hypothetical protein